MDYFLKSINNFLKNTNNDESKKIDELSGILDSIVTNKNNSKKYDHFKSFLEYKKKFDQSNQNIFYTFSLFLYLADITKDFKNDLMTPLKDKTLKSTNLQIFKDFLKILEELNLTQSGLLNSNNINTKMQIFNNFYEAIKIIYTDEVLYSDDYFTNKFINIFQSILFNDLHHLISNVNEDVHQLLIMFFKYLYAYLRGVSRDTLASKFVENLKSMLKGLKSELISHVSNMDLVLLNKDFEFNFSTSVFLLENIIDSFNYAQNSIGLLNEFVKHSNHLMIYIKSYLINFPELSEDVIITKKYSIFNIFLEKYLISNSTLTNKESLTLMEFYSIFLDNDLKSNFTAVINDFILISIHRLSNSNLFSNFISFVKSNNIISKIFEKMKRDKNNFNIMDDNYYYILEALHKLSDTTKTEVENFANSYLNNLISKKERLMMIEAKMFKFIDFNKEQEGKANTIKSFFIYIFTKPYEKKNLTLINEYIKILFEYFFTSNLNNNSDNKHHLSVYKKFIDIFPEPFFNYLVKLHSKDLKFFYNILINLEKFNKNLYSLIVHEFYVKHFSQENSNLDYIKKFSIFLTLLKPFKNHKKTVAIKDGKIMFDHLIIEGLQVKFELDLKELKNITKLSDRYLVLYLIEFLNGLDEQEKIFPIIKTLLKYNIKSSYVEYKSSIMKSLISYFKDYSEKVNKYLNKSKPLDSEVLFVEKSYENYSYLFKFLSDNIYDRPVENLLVYLDLLKVNIDLLDNVLYSEKIKNTKMKKLKEDIVNTYEKVIFNKHLAFSLVSLLRQSWYFVRMSTFSILKNNKFEIVLREIKNILKDQVKEYLFSLRQMDAEGSVNLFLLMIHHFKESFLDEFSNEVFKTKLSYKSKTLKMKSLELFHQIILTKKSDYIEKIKNKDDTNITNYSVHSYFVLIRNLLEEEKESTEIDCNLLLEVGMDIIEINKNFSIYLINNGVSEFSTDFDETGGTDGEDKGLISLWCSAKYSIESLNIILDIVSNNFKIFVKEPNFESKLKILVVYLSKIINLMTEYKHMGAVVTFNESLLKVARLLNLVDESYISYSDITNNYVKDFLENKLVNEEVCSTLRRSAGIPFILTTLIKSYISYDKHSSLSYNKVVEILKSSIETLLSHYKAHQSTPDVAVHCLHILRVISDDTHLKPFAKQFYDYIILNIVDGLGNINWSIKNACMLLFSRLIKNSFTLYDIREKTINTFVEYFTGKEELKNKILSILRQEVTNKSNECNDSLILLITFFAKFKQSKLAEINEKDLTDMIDILINLSYKNNKLFRKLLSSCIVKLYGDNIRLVNDKILKMFEEKNISNNKIDFIFNLIKNIKENFDLDNDLVSQINAKCVNILETESENYFLLNKVVKFYTKVIPNKFEVSKYLLKYANNTQNSYLDLKFIFNNLKSKSRKAFYSNLIKNVTDHLLNTGNFKIKEFSFDLIAPHNEELINFILKKYSDKLIYTFEPKSLIAILTKDNLLSKLNVNISTKFISFILKSEVFCNLFNIDKELSENLLVKAIQLTEENKFVTKLVKKLLNLISKLYIIVNKEKFHSKILSIVLEFCLSHNEEKTRLASIKLFEEVILNKNCSVKDKLSIILNLFIYIINDEHPEIRNYSCQLFFEFNSEVKLIKIQNLNKINSKSVYYSNEFLIEKLVNLSGKENCSHISNFYNYLITENLYFSKDKSKMNSDNKVFYYEPDNRFVDNIEIKIKILKNLILQNESEFVKEVEKGIISQNNASIKPLGVLTMLESFVEFISENFVNLKKVLKISDLKEFKRHPYILIREYIYNY